MQKRVVILGSTGSIGKSALDVVSALPSLLKVVGLSAHHSVEELREQAKRYSPRFVVLTSEAGEGAVEELCSHPETDIVLNAIVGSAGLRGSLATMAAGKTLALANKETLVSAGPVVMELLKHSKTKLLPVDSEHSAIFQILQERGIADVERVVLTASGGPFRGKTKEQLKNVSPEEALKHPTWQMGRKITIDSATLMNKALEVIEAHWLFGLAAEQIEVVIHPESIIHSFVEFKDGSVLAQLSPPDMKLPIQYALTYPERYPGPTRRLSWRTLSSLTFSQPDRETFPALDLGYEVIRQGGTAGAVVNAANEAAVARFLSGTLAFLDIARATRDVLQSHAFIAQPTVQEIYQLDTWARQEINRWQKT